MLRNFANDTTLLLIIYQTMLLIKCYTLLMKIVSILMAMGPHFWYTFCEQCSFGDEPLHFPTLLLINYQKLNDAPHFWCSTTTLFPLHF
jgi:hypothetical protein